MRKKISDLPLAFEMADLVYFQIFQRSGPGQLVRTSQEGAEL